jgi:hypothetical protein
MRGDDIAERLIDFAVRIIRLVPTLLTDILQENCALTAILAQSLKTARKGGRPD